MYCGPEANAANQNNEAIKMYFERINEVDNMVNPKINSYMCQSSYCPCSNKIRDASEKWDAINVNIRSNSYYYSDSSETVAFAQAYECLTENGSLSDSSSTTEYGL